MKAAVFYEANDLRVEDVPEPDVADDEVLVEVAACGFCGSDVEYYYGKSPVGTATGKGPLVLGHEFSGKVVGLGKLAGAYGLAEGDRVAVNPIQSCNACNSCRAGKPQFCQNLAVLGVTSNGGFATYARTKAAHAYKLPDSLSDEQGAFVEMLSAAVNAVRKADVQPGELAVVFGPGPVGLSMVQLLRRQGARVAVVGTRPYRLALAKELGADIVIDIGDGDAVEQLTAANDGALADRAIVATGSMAANQQALAITGPGSTVVYMGVTGPEDKVELPMLTSLIQDKTIRFSLWYPNQWPTTLRLLQDAQVDTGKIITHSASLDGIAGAIERVVNREDHVIKTVIKPYAAGVKLQGRVAIVTGAARERGIGRGIALCLAQEGCDVVVNDVAAEAEGEALCEQIRALGRQALFVQADVCDRPQVDALVGTAVRELGRLDVVCSNAGVADWQELVDVTPESFRRQVGINLTGAFNVCQAGARALVAQGSGGRLVVTSSVHVQMPFAQMSVYGATKQALRALVEHLAIELAPHGITANHLGPGWVRSFINDSSPSLQTDEEVAATLQLIPAGRPAEPADLGRAAVYLASADGAYVTGEFLRVDGGFVVGKYGGA